MVLQKACFVELGRDEKRRLQSTDKNAVKAAIFFWSTPKSTFFQNLNFIIFYQTIGHEKCRQRRQLRFSWLTSTWQHFFTWSAVNDCQHCWHCRRPFYYIFHHALKLTILHLNNINFCIWRDKVHVQKIKIKQYHQKN